MDLPEVLALLRDEDEVVLLELLELTSDQIVDKFADEIVENLDRIYRHYIL